MDEQTHNELKELTKSLHVSLRMLSEATEGKVSTATLNRLMLNPSAKMNKGTIALVEQLVKALRVAYTDHRLFNMLNRHGKVLHLMETMSGSEVDHVA